MHRVRGIVRREIERLAAAPALHANPQQSAGALVHREKVAEHVHRLQEHLGVVRHDVAPARTIAARSERRGHDAKILAPASCCESAGARRDLRSGIRGSPRAARLRRRSATDRRRARSATRRSSCFPSRCTGDAPTCCASLRGRSSRRALRTRAGRRRPACRARARVRAAQERDRIFFDVQQRAVVVGPRYVGLRVLDHVAEQLAAGDVLEADPELAAADGIVGVREQACCPGSLRSRRAEKTAARRRARCNPGARLRPPRAGPPSARSPDIAHRSRTGWRTSTRDGAQAQSSRPL